MSNRLHTKLTKGLSRLGEYPLTKQEINVRYDDYKREFYTLCTREYTELWIDRIKELRKWIEPML